ETGQYSQGNGCSHDGDCRRQRQRQSTSWDRAIFSRQQSGGIVIGGSLYQPVPCREAAVKRLLCCVLSALVGALLLSRPTDAETCLSPFVKRLDRPEKYL